MRTETLPIDPRAVVRSVAGWSLAVTLMVLSGCVGFPSGQQAGLTEKAEAQACLDMDMAYLERLNAGVKEGRLTLNDKELLWRAYLVRAKDVVMVVARGRLQEEIDRWPYTFVAPMF